MTASSAAPQSPGQNGLQAVPERLVVFAHGMESGPWGTKITHLAQAARREGWDAISPDYSSTKDPDERVAMLKTLAPQARHLVLVGSSMGGYVSAHACAALRPAGLLLLAPALYFAGYDAEPAAIPGIAATVHGINDDVVPVSASTRFAAQHRTELHLVHDDHRLVSSLPVIEFALVRLLRRVLNG